MIARWLMCAAALAAPALAQLQVFQFDGVNETPAGSLVDIGTAAPGDSIEVRFKVRNTGNAPAVFSTLTIAGAGFKASSLAPLPYTIAPGFEAEFRVTFNPVSIGTYSAFLAVNSINITVRGTAASSPVLTLSGGSAPLAAGAVIDFGSVLRGNSRTQTLTLANPGTAPLVVTVISVNGTGFGGPAGIALPVQIDAGKSAAFDVTFSPQSPQPAKGTLVVDQRSFTLSGLGLDPPLPTASIAYGSQVSSSGQQNTISIPLASPAQVSGTGTLTMEFHSSVTGVSDDAAIQFLSGPRRAATVLVNPGDTTAHFGTQSSIAFQTGTTAGTIVFTLTLPNGTQQASMTLTPAPASIDTATVVRRVNDLDVSLTGFDNTYSTSQLAFTFYDRNGATMQPGMIRVDVSNDFRLYFAAAQAGGTFALRATFPVTGDATTIGAVDVQVTNSAGVAKVDRISF